MFDEGSHAFGSAGVREANRISAGETPDFANDDRFVDIHAICATVKSFLRQLPDPLIPFQYHNAAIASAGMVVSVRASKALTPKPQVSKIMSSVWIGSGS